MKEARYGHRVGDDGGCFESALNSVRTWGGVLEHPAFSYAWKRFNLPAPVQGAWTGSVFDQGMVTEVSQAAYGHPARKLTWLYAVTRTVPTLKWEQPEPTAQVSFCKNHGNSPLPRLSKKAAKRTPLPFRDLLVSIAEGGQ